MRSRTDDGHIDRAPAALGVFRVGFIVVALAALSACGGGGGGGDSGSSGTSSNGVFTGVMTKGSVIVNGVRFEDSSADISLDDTPKTSSALRDGMVVQLLGSVNADGVNGTATRVEAQIEVRGTVTSVNVAASPQSFVVLGQTVVIEDTTLLNDITAPITIGLVGTVVEVHGLRDASGRIRATRIEANPGQMGDNTVDEIRGVVSGGTGSNPPMFLLGSQLVDASGAVISPVGAIYQNGSVVEVHCSVRPCVNGSGRFQVSRLEVEDAEDSGFNPGVNGRFEVEGLISGFTGGNSFFVAGVPVQLTGSTRFEGGISSDLANDIKVEAEGNWDGSTLVARKIQFKRKVVRLQGTVSNPTGQSFTLNILGAGSVTVEVDDFTDTNGQGVPQANSFCIEVRGQRKAGSGPVVVIAGEIKADATKDRCSNGDRHLIQAPVEVESGTILTLLGFAINVASPTDNPPYENLDGSAMSQSQFLNAVSTGTLVKVSFDKGSTSVHQVELED